MSATQTELDPRAEAARTWGMSQLGLASAQYAPASADASFRRYFRISTPDQSWVLMDAPPARENSAPFIEIASRLAGAGLNVPRVLAADLEQGFLLLSDLGLQTYLQVLDAQNADTLFTEAITALVQMQSRCDPQGLPAYDAALLRRELDLFPEWFVGRHQGRSLNAAQQSAWDAICALLVDSALAQPCVFVHRDFMPRNLMLSQPNPGVLDFQDAVCGPVSYDVLCLFKDAFLSWPEARLSAWVEQYCAQALAAGISLPEDFTRAMDWMGLQRHLKVLGIFARICHRDGKPHYLEDAPRFVRYITEVLPRYPALAPLAQMFDDLGLAA